MLTDFALVRRRATVRGGETEAAAAVLRLECERRVGAQQNGSCTLLVT